MRQFSNLYIFGFSSALVLAAAAILSIASISLKDKQNENIEIERQQNILLALGVETTTTDVLTKFPQYVKQSLVVKADGSIVSGKTAAEIDLKKENKKPVKERELPLYIAEKNGERFEVIPVWGNGMWGPIWGNVALESDKNTIHGVNFDHEGETPGLGSQIATKIFMNQFKNKKLFDTSNRFVSISIKKQGTYKIDHYTVDAISGGTITSRALETMLKNSLEPYQNYLSQQKTNE